MHRTMIAATFWIPIFMGMAGVGSLFGCFWGIRNYVPIPTPLLPRTRVIHAPHDDRGNLLDTHFHEHDEPT